MMDGTGFDSLTRNLTTTGSRRGAFRTMAAAGLGLGLTRLDLSEALAKKKRRKKRKKKVNTSPPPLPPPPTQTLGQTCSETSQCIGNLLCQVSNSQQSCYPDNVHRCCVADGLPCDNSCDCCGLDVICNGGYCQGA
jgi:hypothetical protein